MRPSTAVSKLAERLSWLVAAILVLLPFHAILTTWAGSNFGHLDLWRIWKEIVILIMMPPVFWLAWRTPGLKKWLIRSWIPRLFGIYILLYLVLGAWALTHNQVNATALIYAFIVNLRFIGFFIFCAIIASKSDFLRRNWRKLLFIPAAIVIVFGLLQKAVLPNDFLSHFGYGKDTIPSYQTVDANLDYRRIQSTLRGANPLGGYLVLIIPALLIVLRKNRRLIMMSLAASLYLLFYTYSRSAVVGIGLSLLTLIIINEAKFKAHLWTAAILVILISGIGGAYYLRSSQVAQDTILHTTNTPAKSQNSNSLRVKSIQNGLKDIYHEPLGGGPGTAGPASFRNSGHPPRIAENYFLQIGQEVGVIGMVLFVSINILVAKELWIRRHDQLARLLLVSLIGITFINLVSHAWTDDTLAYLWWGLAGIACAPALVKSKH